MIVIDPRRLEPSERERLVAMLGQRPIVGPGELPPRWFIAIVLAGALVATAWCMRADELFQGEPLIVRGQWFAWNVGIMCGSMLMAIPGWRNMARMRRSPWPIGRLLYPFGLVTAGLDEIVIVEGRDLRVSRVEVGALGRDGKCPIEIELVTGDGRIERLRTRGIEGDVSAEALAALREGRWATIEGYRDAAPLPRGQRRPRARLARALLALAAYYALSIALVWLFVAPERALQIASSEPEPMPYLVAIDRAFSFSWVRPRVQHAIAERRQHIDAILARTYREPYRSALRSWLAAFPPGQAPPLGGRDEDDANDPYTSSAAPGPASSEIPDWFGDPLDEVPETSAPVVPTWFDDFVARDALRAIPGEAVAERRPAQGGLTITRRRVPRGVLDLGEGVALATPAVEVRWTLEVPGAAPIERSAIVEPPDELRSIRGRFAGVGVRQGEAVRIWEEHMRRAIRATVLSSILLDASP